MHRDELYQKIGKTFGAKASPKLIGIGVVATLGVQFMVKIGKRGIKYYNERMQLIVEEPNLKKEFHRVTKGAISKEEIKEEQANEKTEI